MTRRKIYRDMIDELDLVGEITKLISQPMPESSFPYVAFHLTDIEYEDDEHLMHYAPDMLKRVLEKMGYSVKDGSDHIYKNNQYTIAFKAIYDTNEFVIQRQS